MTQDPKTTDIPPSEGAYTPPEQRSSRTAEFFSDLWTLKGPLMVVISVAGTLPLLLLVEGTEAKCAYVLIVMAILWLTEAIPIPVTSLFPVFMFPLVGVLPAADTANSYMGKTSLLFIGGLLVAIAVEETNLHRRLALSVLKIVGSDPKWLMLGLMAPTWFLSMWISNTATSSMMVPIVEAILDQLKGTNKESDASLDQLADDINKSLDAGKRKKKISYELADTTDTKKRIREYGVYRQNSEKSWDGSVDSDNTIQHILHETGLSVPRNKQEKKANGDVSETQVDIDCDQDSQSSATRRDSASSDTASATGALTNGKSDVTFSNNNDTFHHTNHSSDNSGKKVTIIDNNDKKKKDDGSEDEEFKRLCKAFSLSIAYAANTGGIATLTGTPPNLVFNGQAARLYEKYNADPEVTFLKWMSMAFPLALLLLVLAWLWLGIFFLRLRFLKHDVSRKRVVQKIIMTEYAKIGPISFAEVSTLVLFVILALLWLSRKPEFVDGWSELFLDSYVDDSTCAVLIGCLFFILPAKMPNVFCWRDKNAKPSYTPLLTWKVAQRKMPWGIIVLLGGGFAVAKGCTTSGLSDWLGKQLATFDTLDPWVLNLVISIIVAMATEVTSNTATATLLMPVTFELAVRLQVNPLYLMASTALATSFAFMMPVATPPNAIVFSHGRLSIPDMASAGAIMNVLAVLALTFCVNTWGAAIFDFNTLPEVFKNNVTSVASS